MSALALPTTSLTSPGMDKLYRLVQADGFCFKAFRVSVEVRVSQSSAISRNRGPTSADMVFAGNREGRSFVLIYCSHPALVSGDSSLPSSLWELSKPRPNGRR